MTTCTQNWGKKIMLVLIGRSLVNLVQKQIFVNSQQNGARPVLNDGRIQPGSQPAGSWTNHHREEEGQWPDSSNCV